MRHRYAQYQSPWSYKVACLRRFYSFFVIGIILITPIKDWLYWLTGFSSLYIVWSIHNKGRDDGSSSIECLILSCKSITVIHIDIETAHNSELTNNFQTTKHVPAFVDIQIFLPMVLKVGQLQQEKAKSNILSLYFLLVIRCWRLLRFFCTDFGRSKLHFREGLSIQRSDWMDRMRCS